jgi:AcrR family transcriptional regulator
MATKLKPARRRRDPESTRIAILNAAKTVLARDGAEGLSVSTVAQIAGVNRGTAYQHFSDKDELVRATLDWVSQQLLDAVFEEGGLTRGEEGKQLDVDLTHLPEVINGIARFNIRLSKFAVDNPEIGRIWLYDVLSRKNPTEDAFFKRFERSLQNFADSDASEPNIDVTALAVLMLTGYFLWPVWVDAHAKTKKAKQKMAERYALEVLRVSMHGMVHADGHATLETFLERNL